MPSHTISSAVIKLFLLGVPWQYPTWQQTTSITHGLFPVNDAELPKGWSRVDCDNIRSYFNQYAQQPTEDDKIAFASRRNGSALPGRNKWKEWVTSRWKTWRIHDKITAILAANNIHPLSLAMKHNIGDGRGWPASTTYIPNVLDAIGLELFGEEALDEDGILPYELRLPVQALVQRTWSNLTRRIDRSRARFAALGEEATEAFTSMFTSFSLRGIVFLFASLDLDRDKLTKAKLTAVIRAVARWKDIAQILNSPDNLQKIEEMEDELGRLMSGLGATVKKAVKITGSLIVSSHVFIANDVLLTDSKKRSKTAGTFFS